MKTLGLWLLYLLPANPVLLRILWGGSRRVRHLLVRCSYLATLIILILVGLILGQGMAGTVDLSTLAQAGSQVFVLIAYGQVILVCLLAPIFMAGAIQAERAGETMDILLTTPLSNLQIVLGTLFGRLFFVLALLASGLPLFSVLLIFGGVPVSSIFIAFAVAALVTITVGSVAILLAVLRKGGRKAVYIFVIGIAAYLVGCYAADRVVRLMGTEVVIEAPEVTQPLTANDPLTQDPNQPIDPFADPDAAFDEEPPAPIERRFGRTTWLTPLHPMLVLEASLNKPSYRLLTEEDLAGRGKLTKFYLGNPLGAFATWNLLLSGALILFSALQLRRIGQGEAMIPLPAGVRRVLRLRGPGERRRPPRTVKGNPVAWRESNTRGKLAGAILGRWGFVAIGLLAAGGLLLAYHNHNLPELKGFGGTSLSQAELFKYMLMLLLWIELAIVVLVALFMSAGCVSREREDGTLDLMLTTPITPQQYVWGKVRGLVSFLAALIAVPVFTLAMVSVYTLIGEANGWEQAQMSYTLNDANAQRVTGPLILTEAPILLAMMLVPFVAFCVAIGMMASISRRTVIGALLPSVGAVLSLSLVCGLCGPAASNGMPIIGPIINAFSVSTNILMLLNPWETVSDFGSPRGAGRYTLIVAALIAAGGYSVIVYSMLRTMVSRFDHSVRRLSGTG